MDYFWQRQSWLPLVSLSINFRGGSGPSWICGGQGERSGGRAVGREGGREGGNDIMHAKYLHEMQLPFPPSIFGAWRKDRRNRGRRLINKTMVAEMGSCDGVAIDTTLMAIQHSKRHWKHTSTRVYIQLQIGMGISIPQESADPMWRATRRRDEN